jgi:hypothetical protein
MSKITRLEEFRRATADARRKTEAERVALDATAGRPAQPGDIYLFPGDGDAASRWVVVAIRGADGDALFAVPADEHPLYGLADVQLDDNAHPPMSLRCGLGHWLPREAFRADRRLRMLSTEALNGARDKVRQVIRASLDGPEAARESETNPDYLEWMDRVVRAADRVAAAANGEPGTAPSLADEWEDDWDEPDFSRRLTLSTSELRPVPLAVRPDATPALELAATSPGFLEAPATPTQPVLGYQVDIAGPAQLILVPEPGGVRAIWRSDSRATPPPGYTRESSGDWSPLDWKLTPGRTSAGALVAWLGDLVVLRFGDPGAPVEVAIPRS